MHISDDPKLQEDLLLIESDQYLTRYHACERILRFYELKHSIADLRRVFGLIVDKRYPNIINGPKDYQEARIRLLNFIQNEKFPQDLAEVDPSELNEQLMDALYFLPSNDERIQKLLEAGADWQVKDERGMTAFLYAGSSRNRKWILYFLEKGADINENIPNSDCSVFINNVGDADLDWLKKMAGFEANLHLTNRRGENSVAIASKNSRSLKKVKWLYKQGVELEIPNINGETALFQACMRQDIKLLHWFGKKGCNPDHVSSASGITPLHWAVEKEHKNSVRALLKVGANPNLKNKNGKDAYQIAMGKGFVDIAILLKGEKAREEFDKSEANQKVNALKLEILIALKDGKSWATGDREGRGKFWFENGKYHEKYQDHLSDYGYENSFKSDKKAIELLYGKARYGWGTDTIVAIYEKILQNLR